MGGTNAAVTRRVVKPGQGIVGRAATEKAEAAIIVNPSKESGFSPEVDLPGGGAAAVGPGGCNDNVVLMCGPVKNGAGEVWGVLTVANPADGGNSFDENALAMFRCPLFSISLFWSGVERTSGWIYSTLSTPLRGTLVVYLYLFFRDVCVFLQKHRGKDFGHQLRHFMKLFQRR